MSAWELAVILATVLVAYYLKGILGLGGPVLVIPVLAAVVGLEFAVAVIAIPNLIANTMLVWRSRGEFGTVRTFLWPLLITGIVGTALGSWALVSLDDRWASIGLAAIVLVYVAWTLISPDFSLGDIWARRLAPVVGFVGGAFQGGTGVSGPVIATYVHSLNLSRPSFVLAITLPFQVLSVVQVTSLSLLGAYDRERLIAAAIAVVPMAIAMIAGMRLGPRLSSKTFNNLVLLILVLAAIRLIWSAL
ncbi:MAG: sulfite exporter TauE/SafE family protein [Acidimicrobiia bacterium]